MDTGKIIKYFAVLLLFSFTAVSVAQNNVIVGPIMLLLNEPESDIDPESTYELGAIGPAGGAVFHVTSDGRHGLEAALTDQSSGINWCGFYGDTSGVENLFVDGMGDPLIDPNPGSTNTTAILGACGATSTAAGVASGYRGPDGQTTGWYLPNVQELQLLYANKFFVLIAGGDIFASKVYWSSSEYFSPNVPDWNENAWAINFSDGRSRVPDKLGGVPSVRAIRAF